MPPLGFLRLPMGSAEMQRQWSWARFCTILQNFAQFRTFLHTLRHNCTEYGTNVETQYAAPAAIVFPSRWHFFLEKCHKTAKDHFGKQCPGDLENLQVLGSDRYRSGLPFQEDNSIEEQPIRKTSESLINATNKISILSLSSWTLMKNILENVFSPRLSPLHWAFGDNQVLSWKKFLCPEFIST